MVKISTLQKAVLSGNIKKVFVTEYPSKENLTAENATYSKRDKNFRFYSCEGDLLFKIHRYCIRTILNVSDDDNEFAFIIETKNHKSYKMQFIMKSGYSFFAADGGSKENVSSVLKIVPKYLCDFKNKRVKVSKSIFCEALSKYDAVNDLEKAIITDSFTINDFDYAVKNPSGLAVVNFIDNADNNTFMSAVNVLSICGCVGNANSILLGTCWGGYTLQIID